MNDIWIPMFLALFFNGQNENYNHINYLSKYRKYYKYGSDE